MKINTSLIIAFVAFSLGASAQKSVNDSIRVSLQIDAMLKHLQISDQSAGRVKWILLNQRLSYEKMRLYPAKSLEKKDLLIVQNGQTFKELISILTPQEYQRFTEWMSERNQLYRAKIIKENLDGVSVKNTKQSPVLQ